MKKILAFLVSMSIVLTCLSGLSLVSFAAEATPISTMEQLLAIQSGGNYKLTADIGKDAPLTTSLLSTGAFKGVLDGDGHTIYVDITGTNSVGLFAKSENATIKNLRIKGKVNRTSSSGSFGAGAFVGGATDTSFINCHNEAEVTSNGAGIVGGIAGLSTNGYYEKCSNQGAVSGIGSNVEQVGGFIGRLATTAGDTSVIIKECFNTGNVTTYRRLGAFIGATWDANRKIEFENCYNTGTISGTQSGVVIGYLRSARSTSTAKGIYSTTTCGTLPALEVTDFYIAGVNATEDEIKGLTNVEGSAFAVESVWFIDETTGYSYPQLQENRAPKLPVPYDLSLKAENGAIVLSWECSSDDAEYEVFVNDASQGVINAKSKTISSNGGAAEIYVKATVDGKSYESDKLSITLIATSAQLASVSGDGDYMLIANIGSAEDPVTSIISGTFEGTFDGGDHTVYVNITGTSSVGLFATTNGATIKNLRIKGSVTRSNPASGNYGTGAFAGTATDTSFINCHNEATVTSNGAGIVGGITGYTTNGYYEKCSNQGAVSGVGNKVERAGGFIGCLFTTAGDTSVIIKECFNTGDVFATNRRAGAFIASAWDNNRKIEFENCYNTGTVSSGTAVGVVIGHFVKARPTSTATGIYSLTKCGDIPSADNLAVTDFYMVGALSVTEETIKGLTNVEGSAFANKDVWVLDASKGYKYPQLKGNPAPASSEPYNLKAAFVDGQWTVSWDCVLEGATYEVFVDGQSQGTVENIKSKVITVSDSASSVNVYVKANGTYTSDTITINTEFAGGTGTPEDPYVIVNKAQFGKIKDNLDKSFILSENIGSAEDPVTTMIAGTFTGTLDGGDKTVYVNIEGANNVGLFDITNGAKIESLRIKGKVKRVATSTAVAYGTGAFVGTATDTSFIKCHNEAEVISSGAGIVAGISGLVTNGYYEKCSNQGNVSVEGSNIEQVGGFIGRLVTTAGDTSVIFKECFNTGNITAYRRLGAFIGATWDANRKIEFENCYNTGVVTGSQSGVLIGYMRNARSTSTAKGVYSLTTCGTEPALTLTDFYMVGLRDTTEETIKGLTNVEGSAFANTDVWVVDETTGYDYPQLKSNPAPVSCTPYGLEVKFENGNFVLTWECASENVSYTVYVGGTPVSAPAKTCVVDIAGKENVEIYVVAVSEGKSYQSEKITANGVFAGGNGSVDAPYKVANKAQFEAMANLADTQGLYFEQTAELIELNDYYFKTNANPFKGTYNGKNNTIYVNINAESDKSIGLFGFLTGKLENIVLTGSVTGSVSGTHSGVGGFVGFANANAQMVNLTNKATVVASGAGNPPAAGIVGRAFSGGVKIEGCVNDAEISGAYAAGISGVLNNGATINNCANFGYIKGNGSAAGISYNAYGSISNSYNLGTIEAKNVAAGIATDTQVAFQKIETLDEAGNVTATEYKVNYAATYESCFNAGVLVAENTYGIAQQKVSSSSKTEGLKRTTSKTGALNIINCYNAVAADYPIANQDDAIMNEIASSKEDLARTVSNVYYLAENVDDNLSGTTAVDKVGLIKATLEGYEIAGAYAYPQISSNKIPADKANIDFVLVTLDVNSSNGTAEFKGFDASSIYTRKDAGVAVEIAPAFGYKMNVQLNGVDLDPVTEADEILLAISGDAVISISEEELEAIFPENIVAGNGGIIVSDEPIIVDNVSYSRYAIAAGRADKGVAVKYAEFGMLIAESELASDEFVYDGKVQIAKADIKKINENGWYGMLIHGDRLMNNTTYYVRPYAIYEDKDGNKEIKYGDVQPFEMADPAVDAE